MTCVAGARPAGHRPRTQGLQHLPDGWHVAADGATIAGPQIVDLQRRPTARRLGLSDLPGVGRLIDRGARHDRVSLEQRALNSPPTAPRKNAATGGDRVP